jgi:hypothetical protein
LVVIITAEHSTGQDRPGQDVTSYQQTTASFFFFFFFFTGRKEGNHCLPE